MLQAFDIRAAALDPMALIVSTPPATEGYKEECKYDKAYTAAYKAARVKTCEVQDGESETGQVRHSKGEGLQRQGPRRSTYDHATKGAKVHKVDYHVGQRFTK